MEFCFRNKLLSFAERYQNPMSMFLGKYTEEGGARGFLFLKKTMLLF
jgi:hypothetical protein